MAKKQIPVWVDEDEYGVIAERAAAVGLDPADYARQVLADEGSDQRHQFLGAAAHFTEQWGPHFAERFGHPAPARHEDRGHAA